jgi:hypothetical protein
MRESPLARQFGSGSVRASYVPIGGGTGCDLSQFPAEAVIARELERKENFAALLRSRAIRSGAAHFDWPRVTAAGEATPLRLRPNDGND